MKISISRFYGQFYIIPFLAVTHSKRLNGDYEVFIGWLKWEIVISF